MIFAITSSSRTISLFSTSILLFVFKPLLEKNGFMVFQNFLLSDILLTLISLKYFPLVWWSNLTQKFLIFLKLSQFSSELFFLEIIFEPGSKHYRFSERFSHKDTVVKT